jgi:hypothetical protein
MRPRFLNFIGPPFLLCWSLSIAVGQGLPAGLESDKIPGAEGFASLDFEPAYVVYRTIKYY